VVNASFQDQKGFVIASAAKQSRRQRAELAGDCRVALQAPRNDALSCNSSEFEYRRLNDAMRTDLSHLPPSTPEEIRAMTRNAGLDLPEELMQQFIAVWPAFEAMVRRIPRNLDRAAEPAHSYRPLRIVRG
jgi:hypothetical protein